MWRVESEKRGVGERPVDAGEYAMGVRETGRLGRVVGKCPLDKGGKEGGTTGAFRRGSEGGEYHGKELGASGRREFAVERLLEEMAGELVLPALQGGGVLRWGYGG